MDNNSAEDLFEIDDVPGEPKTESKKDMLSNYVGVSEIVTDVTSYEMDSEFFDNAKKHEILPLLKALKLVEYIDRQYYIRLGTKEYCIELLKELLSNDYVELRKSVKKQILSDDQKLELHNLKREVSYKVYSPLPYFHGTQEGDFNKVKDQINLTLLRNMLEMQGFTLYRSEVLYMEAMMKNINRYLDELYSKSKEYIAHLKKQEIEILALTSFKHIPELNALSVDLKAYVEKFPDNPTYKRLYDLMHENLYEDLLNLYNTPETDNQQDDVYSDDYHDNSSAPNHLQYNELHHEESATIIENTQINIQSTLDNLFDEDDIDIIEI